jgi:hypothetical protein
VNADSRYIALMSSLPYVSELHPMRQTPLSQIRLEQRLRLLEPADARLLRGVRGLLERSRQDPQLADPDYLRSFRRLLAELPSEDLRELLWFRLHRRSLLAAQRYRLQAPHAQQGPHWGLGRWARRVYQHWDETDFAMGAWFPWLRQADRLLRERASLELEKLLLSDLWLRLGHYAFGHHYDFQAVVIYWMRWEVIRRWVGLHGEADTGVFRQLLEQTLESRDD